MKNLSGSRTNEIAEEIVERSSLEEETKEDPPRNEFSLNCEDSQDTNKDITS